MRPNKNIWEWYHALSKDISMGGRVNIPRDMEEWPKSWKTVEYKHYKRCPSVPLLPLEQCRLVNPLTDTLFSRKSNRDFEERGYVMTHKVLSTFIANTISKTKGNYRIYPSGGARYPLEFYFFLKRSSDMALGIYHYNVEDHALTLLKGIEHIDLSSRPIHGYEWANHTAVDVFISAIFERNFRKYGERGYRYVMLEAGHVSQNFYLVSTALGLSSTAVAGVLDINVEDMLYLDGKYESLVHTFLLG